MPDSKQKRVFSGVQPSGAQVHIGNYLGAMKRFVELSTSYPTSVCIVDLHALTSVQGKQDLEDYSLSLAAAYLAIGLDPNTTCIFRQSDVPEVCELTWYLACQFPLGLLERAHALKDTRAKGKNPNSGIMFYPILMAADILLHRADLVPVGADQKQHLEMTREIAQKINSRFGDIFPIPEPLIEEKTGVIPGVDGQKMSKSYDNYIGLFLSEKKLRKKVMSIVTDSKSLEDKKDPEQCNVFKLYTYFASQKEQDDLAERYRVGGMGYGEAKLALFEALNRELSPLRDNYEKWISKPEELREVLAEGGKKAQIRARETIGLVREAIGLGDYLTK